MSKNRLTALLDAILIIVPSVCYRTTEGNQSYEYLRNMTKGDEFLVWNPYTRSLLFNLLKLVKKSVEKSMSDKVFADMV